MTNTATNDLKDAVKLFREALNDRLEFWNRQYHMLNDEQASDCFNECKHIQSMFNAHFKDLI